MMERRTILILCFGSPRSLPNQPNLPNTAVGVEAEAEVADTAEAVVELAAVAVDMAAVVEPAAEAVVARGAAAAPEEREEPAGVEVWVR